MRIKLLTLASVALLAWSATVSSQTTAQSAVSSNSSASVKANKSGAQASGSSNASASAQASGDSSTLDSGTTMNAILTHPVDTKKNKPGDRITAKTSEAAMSGGQVVIPTGSTLVGHVTQAQARVRGEAQSSLGIAFDHAVLKNGHRVPLNLSVLAIAASEFVAPSSVDQDAFSAGSGTMGDGRVSGGGGLASGVGSSAGAGLGAVGNATGSVGGTATGAVSSTSNLGRNTTGSVASSTAGAVGGTVGGLNTAGRLTSNSQGVFGIQGLHLTSAAANDTQGSLITSTGKNVHLDGGTRLLLAARGQAQTSKR